jgi:hypothetical protein
LRFLSAGARVTLAAPPGINFRSTRQAHRVGPSAAADANNTAPAKATSLSHKQRQK